MNTRCKSRSLASRGGIAGWLAIVLSAGPLTSARADHPMGPPTGMGPPMGMPTSSGADAATIDPSQGSDTTLAPLPGFPGALRIYHLGATDFFLDHPEHIRLTSEQRNAMESVKADARDEQARYRKRIEAAENELWSLTGGDAPDAVAVDQKVREIESIRSEQRMAYIHAVGEAALSLSDEQRSQLTGQAPPDPESNQPPKAPRPGKTK